MTNNQNILLINDLVGVGNLSSTAMMPILAYMGFPTYNLPTSLVSNNFGYGSYAMFDTTPYLRQTFPIWEKLGFEIGAIATGFIPTDEQASLIADFCRHKAAGGTKIFVDPVMADLGQMYSGLPDSIVQNMRTMLSVADLCFPNYTEACLLSGMQYKKEGESRKQAFAIIDKIRETGVGSVLITSIPVDGHPSVAGYNSADGEYFVLGYEEVPVSFSGAGDVFSAIVIGHLLKGKTLKESARKAIDDVYNFIRLNKDAADPYKGIPIEKYLSIL